MKIVIVYDSLFGNTKQCAEKIGEVLSNQHEVKVMHVNDAHNLEFMSIDLLVVGSPVHGGRPSQATKQFLDQIPLDALKNTKVAAFDTRNSPEGQSGFVKFIINFFGMAAPKIESTLVKRGGVVVIPAEGFIVEGKEGPLQEGEIEKVTNWATEINKTLEK